jgi:hypothetical protein
MKEMYATILTLSRNTSSLSVRPPSSRSSLTSDEISGPFLIESSVSIKYFALRLSTVPSVGYHVVRHYNVVARILAIITAFFTNQIEGKHITFPANANVEVIASRSSNPNGLYPSSAISAIEPVQKLIAHDRDFIAEFAKVYQLFMCINPKNRAATSHVEYETDAWISVFNVTLSLSRVVKVYGEACVSSTTTELVACWSAQWHTATDVTGTDTLLLSSTRSILHALDILCGRLARFPSRAALAPCRTCKAHPPSHGRSPEGDWTIQSSGSYIGQPTRKPSRRLLTFPCEVRASPTGRETLIHCSALFPQS